MTSWYDDRAANIQLFESRLEDYLMSTQHFIGKEIDALVGKLSSTKTGANTTSDVVQYTESKDNLQAQLFRYAEDIQKLLAERDMAETYEKEKNAAYKQLERFNHDFIILMEQK